MGNYIKRILAILFVLTLAAPVGSHGTFGSSQFLSFTAGSSNDGWPVAVDPPSASSVCLRHDEGTSANTCVSSSNSSSEDTQYVMKGWKLRGLYCMKQKGFSAAGADFELEIGLLMIKSGEALVVEKVSPVLRITNDIVTAKHGGTELLWMDFNQTINYTVPYNGHVGFTFYKSDIGGNTSTRFEWRCTVTIEAGS